MASKGNLSIGTLPFIEINECTLQIKTINFTLYVTTKLNSYEQGIILQSCLGLFLSEVASHYSGGMVYAW